ncbi:MAG: alginate export family protein [Lentisphaerae bacterium]|nr:alginate export family protein [Lentisphaerota bacterium]
MSSVDRMCVMSVMLAVMVCGVAVAEEPVPVTPVETHWLDALTKGTPKVDVRLRYEHADQEGLKASDAVTVRPRVGYETQPIGMFRGYIEFEDVAALNNSDDYNAAGTNPGGAGRTSIADVEGAELNQAYVLVTCPLTGARATLGRQRLGLDNERFIGSVGWRQNDQVYDAASIAATVAERLDLQYSYIDNVNRIYGEAHGTTPAGERFNAADLDSDSHLLHATARLCPHATLAGYGYLLDLGDGGFGASNSSDTVGMRLTGAFDVREGVALKYEGEYARQSDNDATAAGMNYDAEYYRGQLECAVKPVSLGAGYEVLGSDNGVGFQTPLATLHAFNGWADVFLNTPGSGLRDCYVFAGARLPLDLNGQVAYHDFGADTGSLDYGTEADAKVSRTFGQSLTLLAKYATYHADGDPANPRPADVDKVMVEATFAF